MNPHHKLHSLLAVLIVVATSACAPIGDTPAAGRCRVKFAQPYAPYVTSGHLVRGEASAVCTGSIEAHSVTLYLERQAGTGWEPRDEDTSTQIPYLQAVALLALTECRLGRWRLRYAVTATHQGEIVERSDASDTLSITNAKDCTP